MNRGTILVVEDERIIGCDVQGILQRAGYQVPLVVSTGLEAVAKADEIRPDLVLMDVTLRGGIDGVEAAYRIRQQQDIPIVYLTANGDREIFNRIKETDPVAFIRKPYEEEELLTTIEISLHQYRTQQERARAALQSSEAKYQELFESARDGIAILDLEGSHLNCNQAYLNLLGYQEFDELPSRAMTVLTAPECREQEARIIREQTLSQGYSDEYEKMYLRRDGSRVTVSARCWLRRNDHGAPTGFWIMVRDITDRKQTERQILEYQRQLQLLMRDLSLAEERERQRIASDIHDRISQTLAVCQMRLGALATASTSADTAREAGEVSQLLDQTIQDTSSLIFELSPPILHQLGLVPALEWFGEKIQQQHTIRVSVQGECAAALASDLRATTFRSVCELVNNAVKHGHATAIRISLSQRADCLRIQVKDNGVGFNPLENNWRKRVKGGYGLFHIQERLRAWGGLLEINSHPGAGTRAQLTLPLAAPPLEATS